MQNTIMFENVRVEMGRKNLSITKMAKMIDMNRETLSRKLSGKTPLHMREAFNIQQKCFPDSDVRVLFKEYNTA